MKRRSVALGLAILITIGLAAGYGAWKAGTSSGQLCQVCRRPVHSVGRTVGLLGGKREVFCCPSCALAAHIQSGKAVEIIALTDFITQRPLAPGGAYLVQGSDVSTCAHAKVMIDQTKQVSPLEFDRCSPSTLAFSSRGAAAKFAAEHGGTVMRFQDFAPAYTQ